MLSEAEYIEYQTRSKFLLFKNNKTVNYSMVLLKSKGNKYNTVGTVGMSA